MYFLLDSFAHGYGLNAKKKRGAAESGAIVHALAWDQPIRHDIPRLWLLFNFRVASVLSISHRRPAVFDYSDQMGILLRASSLRYKLVEEKKSTGAMD